jgi:hypothetical protein
MTLWCSLTQIKIFYNGVLLILEGNMFPESVRYWNNSLGHVTSSRSSPNRSALRNLVCDRAVLLQVCVYAVK